MERGKLACGKSVATSREPRSVFFPRHLRRRGADLSVDAASAGVGLASLSPTAEARPAKKCDLRMRRGIARPRAGAVPIAVLSLLHHFSDLRRRGDFPGAVRGRVHWIAVRSVHRDPRFSAPAARGPRLGLEQRLFRLGADTETRAMSENQIDEGLRSELQKRGVWVTSTQELYNWGRRTSIWPLQCGLPCCGF